TLDTTHVATWGVDLLETYEILAHCVAHVHLSNYDGRQHRLPQDGSLALGPLLAALRRRGYQGAIVVELQPDALEAGRAGRLRGALDADPPNMDPHRSTAAVDRQVYQNLFDKLVDTDENLQIVPMLATAWTISADGKTVTLTLRQGVKFHDGTPFNAEAVKYNFDRMQDPNFPSARRSEVLPVQKVAVVDPYTVALSLEKPYSPLLYVLTDRAGMMVSPAEARKAGTNFALHPVGTGPFSFMEKIPQDHITLVRNPDYWVKGQPY